MKKSVLKVKLCDASSADCTHANNASSGVLKLPKNSTEDQVKNVRFG